VLKLKNIQSYTGLIHTVTCKRESTEPFVDNQTKSSDIVEGPRDALS